MSPEQDAEEAYEQGGDDHNAVGEDFAVTEVGQQHGGEAHAGEDGDIDLGVSEEPEEMEPEEGAAVAVGVEGSVDEVSGGKEEAGAGVAVAEEEQEGSEEDGEGDDGEDGGGEPAPDGKGEAVPGHAGAAELEDGGECVDGAEHGRDGEYGDTGEPEVHAESLTRACARYSA